MAASQEEAHPCQKCGACCAIFRVRFYWREAEADDQENPVPRELTEDYSSFERVMRGTSNKHSCRCVALVGKIGASVRCSIYEFRPTPCRSFEASYESGVHQPRYHLPALTRKDWEGYRASVLAQVPAAAKIESDDQTKNFR